MATTTSTASAPRRCWCARCGRSGADVGWYSAEPREDGYGLAAATVERLCESGHRPADHGRLRDHRGRTRSRAASAGGIEVIVTDHHAPRADGALPDVPDRASGGCAATRPPTCAGPAVAHKLAEALGAATVGRRPRAGRARDRRRPVPLRGENRRLVREGLAQLAGTAAPRAAGADGGLADRSERPRRACLAFRLAPRINAAGRMRRADAGARAAADRRSARAPTRSPRSSTRSTPSVARSSSGSPGRPRRWPTRWASAAPTCSRPTAGIPA